MTLDKIVGLYSNGEYLKARTAASDALAIQETERLYRIIGLVDFRLGNFVSARWHFRKAASIDASMALVKPWFTLEMLATAVSSLPEFDWARYHLGVALFEMRRFMEAREHLDAIKTSDEAGSFVLQAAAELRLEIIRRTAPSSEAIVRLKSLLLEKDCAVSETARSFYFGLIAYAEGRWSDAEEHFKSTLDARYDELIRRVPAAVGVATYSSTIHRKKESTKKYHKQTDTLSVFHTVKKNPHDEYVIMCSADARYFCMFAETFISSVIISCGDVPIHVHIVNPNSESEHLLSSIKLRFPQLRLSASVSDYRGEDAKAYYATSRFLIAPTIITAYGLPLLIADIDAVFVKDARLGVLELRYTDAAFKFNKSENLQFPWTTVFATYTLFSARAAAYTILFEIGCYFWDQFARNEGKNSWWIDQNAIRYADAVAKAMGASIGDIGLSQLNAVIETNQAMEEKSSFICRLKSRFSFEQAEAFFLNGHTNRSPLSRPDQDV